MRDNKEYQEVLCRLIYAFISETIFVTSLAPTHTKKTRKGREFFIRVHEFFFYLMQQRKTEKNADR